MKFFVATALLSASLVGCGQTNGSDQVEEDTCGASSYSNLLGTSIAAVTLPADLNIRIINDGDMVTQDHVVDRLNFELDSEGVIKRVYCG